MPKTKKKSVEQKKIELKKKRTSVCINDNSIIIKKTNQKEKKRQYNRNRNAILKQNIIYKQNVNKNDKEIITELRKNPYYKKKRK